MISGNVALALQGGGSHGAYTWGVLDRLLQDERIYIEAASGASAGAINGAVLAYGWTIGGREGARQALGRFWLALSGGDGQTGLAISSMPASEPALRANLLFAGFFSPYQWNPLNINPLRKILSEHIDFERLRRGCPIKLFIAATRVRDAALKIFTERDLTVDALLASACIPWIHHAVEIEGEDYWDGALTADPPLGVLAWGCSASDIIVVRLNPGRSATPSSSPQIFQRVMEMAFSSSLSAELHTLAMAKRAASRPALAPGRMDQRLRQLSVHLIDSLPYLAELNPVTRYSTDAGLITALRDEGNKRAAAWIEENMPDGGRRESLPMLRAAPG